MITVKLHVTAINVKNEKIIALISPIDGLLSSLIYHGRAVTRVFL